MDRRNRSHPTLTPLTTLPSPSYIYPSTTLPTTPSLLSRPTSLTRLRPTTSTPAAALHKTVPKDAKQRKRRGGGDDNDEWITRTASTLTLTRLEEKGQSWLVARRSSTSLTGEGDEEGEGGYEGAQRELGGGFSRVGSRRRFQLGSRRESLGADGVDADEGGQMMGPDFVDVDEEGRGGEDVDEGEMRRVVMGRVGGWVDWAVGWMDMRGEDVEDEGVSEEGVVGTKGELDLVELQRRLRRKKRDEEVEGGTCGVGKPPEGEQAGVWSDAKWLLGVASKVAL